ncbi:hypothetical protein G7046_g3625 [Stylonectria norvegica]|nr:hypothetical protein G7046_g3625 [Stylonectria norvegica]
MTQFLDKSRHSGRAASLPSFERRQSYKKSLCRSSSDPVVQLQDVEISVVTSTPDEFKYINVPHRAREGTVNRIDEPPDLVVYDLSKAPRRKRHISKNVLSAHKRKRMESIRSVYGQGRSAIKDELDPVELEEEPVVRVPTQQGLKDEPPAAQTKKLKPVPRNALRNIEKKGKYTIRQGVQIRDYRVPRRTGNPYWSSHSNLGFQCRDGFDGRETSLGHPRPMSKRSRVLDNSEHMLPALLDLLPPRDARKATRNSFSPTLGTRDDDEDISTLVGSPPDDTETQHPDGLDLRVNRKSSISWGEGIADAAEQEPEASEVTNKWGELRESSDRGWQ